MNRLRIIIDAVSHHATATTGIGVYLEGQISIIGGSDCNACQALRRLTNSTLRREFFTSRLAAIASIEGQLDVALPFGITASARCLRSAVGSSAVIFVVVAVTGPLDDPLDLALISSQPRKAKKYVREVVASLRHRRVAPAVAIDLLDKIASQVTAAVEEWKESAFTNTLASYKDFGVFSRICG